MRLRRILGLALVVSAASAVAQTTTAPTPALEIATYNPRQLPVVQQPSNRMKNIVGDIAKNTCLRNGGTQAACLAAGAYAGGNGLRMEFDWSWNNIGTIAKNSLGSAVETAAISCAGGAALGATALGAGAVPGCLGGAIFGAIAGGYVGAKQGYYEISQNVKVATGDADKNLTGDGVQRTAGSQQASSSEVYARVQVVLPSSGNAVGSVPTFLNGHSFADWPLFDSRVVQIGTTNSFAQAIRLPVVRNGSANCVYKSTGGGTSWCPSNQFVNYQGAIDPVSSQISSGNIWIDMSAGTMAPSTMPTACATTNACFVSMRSASADAGDGTMLAIASKVTSGNPTTYPATTSVPVVKYVSVAATPLAALAFGPGIKPQNLNDPITNETMAGLVNAIRDISKAGDPVPYNGSNPTTAADVQKTIDANPDLQAKISDLVRPIANPEANGGTVERPIPEPVTIANPSTGTGSGTSSGATTGTASNPTVTKEKDDTDLEKQDFGTVGNPIQPVIDFMAGPLAPFLDVSFTKPTNTKCIPPTFDFRDSLGRLRDTLTNWFTKGGNAAPDAGMTSVTNKMLVVDGTPICDFFNEWYGTIVGLNLLLIAVFVVYAFFG